MNNDRKFGVIIGYFTIFANALITLFSTPYLVKGLGVHDYGVLILLMTVISYLTVFDLGISDALIRFFRQGRTDAKYQTLLFDNMVFLYSLLSLLLIVSICVVYSGIGRWLFIDLSGSELYLVKRSFIMCGIVGVITLLCSPFNAYLVSNEKFLFLKLSELIGSLSIVIINVLLVYLGYGVEQVFLSTVTISLILLLSKPTYAILRTNIAIGLSSKSINASLVKDVGIYAAPIFLGVVASQIYMKLDNFLIAEFIDVKSVSIYAVGLMFYRYLMSLATNVSKVFTPKLIADVDKNLGSSYLTENLINVARIQFIAVYFLLSTLVVFGYDFIHLWLGPDFLDSYTVLLFVLIPCSFDLIGNSRNTFMQVSGLYWYRVCFQLFCAISNVVVTIILMPYYGVAGAAFSTGLFSLICYIYVNVILCNKRIINPFRFHVGVYRRVLLITILLSIQSFILLPSTIISWNEFIAKCFLHLIFLSFLIWFVYLNDKERSTCSGMAFKLNRMS
ncbi:lipopolysaccharide biosynthesis protein [Vibrio sp. WXL210]|uniref:lipopolysaccharide biosynthesis protein n=1 Tax=Vibrio sp. WXL210 TaxID=3450709 RepID=UPI003EC92255